MFLFFYKNDYKPETDGVFPERLLTSFVREGIIKKLKIRKETNV